MREEATTPLVRSGWRWLRLPTVAVTAAAAVAVSTAAAGWRDSGRGGRGVVKAVARPRGWRGLPCRRRGGQRRVAVVEASVVRQREGVMETGGGVESRPATWSSRAARAGAGGCRLRQRMACGDGRGDRGRGCGGGGCRVKAQSWFLEPQRTAATRLSVTLSGGRFGASLLLDCVLALSMCGWWYIFFLFPGYDPPEL
uniref:Uncharacterized protein n=1 Tax=Oryza rufipogon TaxID=4529 RepID=A0A0E0QQQ6_ORYRU